MTEHIVQGRLLEGFDPSRVKQFGQGEEKQDWSDIFRSYQNDFVLEGTLEGFDRIGNTLCGVVYYQNIRVIIPLALSGFETTHEYRDYAGLPISFIVKEFDQQAKTVVGSRLEALKLKAEITRRKIKVDDIVMSVVRRIRGKFIYLDIGGIEAVMSISELRHGWVQRIEDELEVGDAFEVKILAIDPSGEVKVSAKALQPDPWETDVVSRFKVGNEYLGTISGVMDYGNFINIAQGIDAYAQHLKFESLHLGDKVLVRVQYMNIKERRIVARIVKVGV